MKIKTNKGTSEAVKQGSAAGTTGNPRTLRIPITNVFDESDYSAQILIGSEQIPANVILDTGSSTLAVVPSVYNAAKDKNVKPTTLAQQVLYGTGAWLGPVVNTTLTFGDSSGGGVSLARAPIAITEVQSPNDFTGVDGIMGLAYLSLNNGWDLKEYLAQQKINPPFTYPWPFPTTPFAQAWDQFLELTKSPTVAPKTLEPYFQELETQGLTMNKFAFYTLRSWVRCATTNNSAIARDPWNNGFFVLGGGEELTDLYAGSFENVDVLHDVYYNTNLISVQVDGCPAVKAKPLQPQYSAAASNCIIDTGTNPLVLSNDVFQAVMQSLEKLNPKFANLIRQAQPQPGAGIGSISSSLLDLSEWPGISFILTGDTGRPVKLTCSPQTYWQEDFPGPGLATFQIVAAGSKTSANQSILGLPLMNNYYTVFDRSLGAGKGIIRFAPIVLPQDNVLPNKVASVRFQPVVDRATTPVTAQTQCQSCLPTAVNLKLTVAAASTAHVSLPPTGDFLVVTWTDAETSALATVFGGGKISYKSESETNFTPLVLPNLPLPPDSKAHAYFFKASVNGKSVICLKSEFHPKTDSAGCTLLFQEIVGHISKRNIQTLITSGTAGGIWANLDVGDVVVTNQARYGLTFPPEKQQLPPYTGLANINGSAGPSGYATWFDYATAKIIQADSCVLNSLGSAGGRKAGSGKPAIYYKAPASELTDVVTNSREATQELTKLAFYRTIGATLDEDDAYVADACNAIGFKNWISIRNVSDLPGHPNQYPIFGLCSSLNGAYAIWAFIMGH